MGCCGSKQASKNDADANNENEGELDNAASAEGEGGAEGAEAGGSWYDTLHNSRLGQFPVPQNARQSKSQSQSTTSRRHLFFCFRIQKSIILLKNVQNSCDKEIKTPAF